MKTGEEQRAGRKCTKEKGHSRRLPEREIERERGGGGVSQEVIQVYRKILRKRRNE